MYNKIKIKENGIISIRKNLLKEIKETEKVIHAVLIATKPDIIKQAPLILELKKENEFVVVIHSGQHYSWNLSKGMEEEFGIVPDINLNVKGKLFEQQSQIINRLGIVLEKIGKKVIPYTYGDTTTALAGGIACFALKNGVAHVEAGLRTMTPPKEIFDYLMNDFSVEEYYEKCMNPEKWTKGSYEPYPEQFDTRGAAPSAGIHFAPTELNAEHLRNEGYEKERIFTVGNPVVDALEFAEKRIKESTIFEKYPVLEEGNLVRFCIHRRENISSMHRFKVLYASMVSLVEEGQNVLLISLGATEKALQEYNLREKTKELAKTHKNFVYSGVWPEYTDVIAAMKKCRAIATDSGSIQEETNSLGIPGIVLRFNSDRPEAVFEGSNIIAPPIKKEIVLKIVKEVMDSSLNKKMRNRKKIYGKNVSKKIVEITKKITEKEELFELFEHERLGLSKKKFWIKGGIKW
ncbi:MAG: UDP-N-acetylglucosamine 2-epimerase [Candidatus Diapherotrites archaeon]